MTEPTPADLLVGLLRLETKTSTTVYPGYLASRIKRGLSALDSEQIIENVGEIETVGDCRYAIPVTDFNGTRYRITVEVEE